MTNMSSQPLDASTTYANNNDDIHDMTFAKRGCCFWIPFLGTEDSPSNGGGGIGSVFWQRINPLDSNPNTPTTATSTTTAVKEPWWARGWKKIREWSEIVAGPKWKTLIRRFSNKRRNNGGHYFGRQVGQGKFQYDPLSYSLNFDEGLGHNGHFDKDLVGRGFSSRYSLPVSTKASMDFEKDTVGLVLT